MTKATTGRPVYRVSRRTAVLAFLLAIEAGCQAAATPAAAPTTAPATAPTTAPASPAPAAKATAAAPAATAPPTTAPAAKAPATPRPVQKVSLRLDFLARGYHVIFLAAKELGYYAENGIDLSVGEGQGSGQTLQIVASGAEQFGFVDAGVLAKGVEEGAEAKMILGVFQQNMFGILSPKDKPLTQPKQLEGKQLAYTAAGVGELMWPVFVKRTGIDESKVTILNVAATAKASLMQNGRADGAFHLVPTDSTIYESSGFQVAALRYADFGLARLGTGLAVNGKALRDQADLVRRFVAATRRGLQTGMEKPDLAPTLVKKAFTVQRSDESVRLEWTRMQEYLQTQRTKGKPIGWMDAADWQDTQQVLLEADFLKQRLPVDRFYTNEFIQ